MEPENTTRNVSTAMLHPLRAVEKCDFVLLCARRFSSDETVLQLFQLGERTREAISEYERYTEEAALARARLSDDISVLRMEYELFTTKIQPMRMDSKQAKLLPELQVDIATKFRYRLAVARSFANEYGDSIAHGERALRRYERTLEYALSVSANRALHRRKALSSSYLLRDACVNAKREVLEKMPTDAPDYRALRALVLRTRRPKMETSSKCIPAHAALDLVS